MRVRAYCDSDWPAVRDIYDLAKSDEMRGVVTSDAIPPLDRDPEMKVLFRESQIFVMEDDNRIVGFGGNKGNFISWLFVHPAHRRRGVATALVRAITSRLNGSVTLNVATENIAARCLYERLGFIVEQEFTGHFKGHPCRICKLRREAVA
jgi:ribosomal protein S18 acetylase RimI-like enzyme